MVWELGSLPSPSLPRPCDLLCLPLVGRSDSWSSGDDVDEDDAAEELGPQTPPAASKDLVSGEVLLLLLPRPSDLVNAVQPTKPTSPLWDATLSDDEDDVEELVLWTPLAAANGPDSSADRGTSDEDVGVLAQRSMMDTVDGLLSSVDRGSLAPCSPAPPPGGPVETVTALPEENR